MSAPADPSRRRFCEGCCLLLAASALRGGTQQPGPPEATTLRVTRETKAAMAPGAVKDYRKEGRFFLMADGKGIYALTAICTHNGCTVGTAGPEGFLCPCHDSEYDRQGNVTMGPAKLPLRHLQVRETTPGGVLEVDLAVTVPAEARL